MHRKGNIPRIAFFGAVSLLLSVIASAQTILQEQGESRKNERHPPDQVMAAIGVRAGMVVGEVGAGFGRYTVHLASKVGPGGKVYAEDIDRESVAHLRERCRRAGLSNVEVILGKTDDPLFPKAGLDLVIMVLTYHHLAHPVALLKKLIPSLKPGGIVVVVDPEATKDPGSRKSEFTSEEKISREAAAAGFELARVETFLPKDNIYILRVKAS
jgi:predicted methyltransferase